ncbi:MAG: Gldg family protein, partial [candidate division Zixibacteria bacterium]|nr:Gldg family protein [candidate division Zixibacteria bacterium]
MRPFEHLGTILRRELAAYFNSAIAYIFIIVFILFTGGLYMTQFFVIGRADMRPFFLTLPFVLAVFLPAVTMRLWAEEKRGNTLELLLTFPMATHELVLGKFFAGLIFYLTALGCTLPVPLMLGVLGDPDGGAVFGGYFGSFLIGAFFLAAGIFISGLCRDQIVAFILSLIVCFSLHLLGTEFFASSTDGWLPGFGSFLRFHLGSAARFDAFAKGVIDNRDILYFLAGTSLFLVLNGFWLEGRMRPGARRIFTTASLVSAGIFLAANWLFAGIPLGRFDLTEGRIYTVSPASKDILRRLKAPVIAKYYVSPLDKMPTGMKTLEQDVVDKLDEL